MKKQSIILFSLLVTSAFAQINIKQTLAGWDRMSNVIQMAAERMPEEHYDYSPNKPLSTYAGLINHYSFANYSVFAPSVKLDAKKFDQSKTDKKTVTRHLKESLAFIRAGIADLNDKDLAEEVTWWGQKTTRLNAILTMTDHFQRELGKVFTYMRLKGISPLADKARARGW